MENQTQPTFFRFEKGALTPVNRPVVREFPLRLTVNGRELATLVASPHQLNFLVAGFFRLQGFIQGLDDILSLGICEDFGAAQVRLHGEVPDRLRPTLTSGCGTGIAFNLPRQLEKRPVDSQRFSPAAVIELMHKLAQKAENYASHGGIHSAAVGDGQRLLLYAEDIGRHNTLDRIAGEALFRGIDLAGKMLVTSGRVSTEMVAKAARLGIALIASRTSPTDQAVAMSDQAGITLIGYLRGKAFEVYTHARRLSVQPVTEKIPGITGVILAGGESRRMGSDKSLLPLRGARFIDLVYRRLAELFDEVVIVTNSPGLYQDLPCRKVPDIYYAQGSLAGIHSGLCHARNEHIFVVACDMPFVSAELVRYLCSQAGEGQVVFPCGDNGHEPLHALYHKSCIAPMETALDDGKRRIVSFFPAVQVRAVTDGEMAAIDPQGLSFRNINTPEEYFALRDRGQEEPPAAAGMAATGRWSG